MRLHCVPPVINTIGMVHYSVSCTLTVVSSLWYLPIGKAWDISPYFALNLTLPLLTCVLTVHAHCHNYSFLFGTGRRALLCEIRLIKQWGIEWLGDDYLTVQINYRINLLLHSPCKIMAAYFSCRLYFTLVFGSWKYWHLGEIICSHIILWLIRECASTLYEGKGHWPILRISAPTFCRACWRIERFKTKAMKQKKAFKNICKPQIHTCKN